MSNSLQDVSSQILKFLNACRDLQLHAMLEHVTEELPTPFAVFDDLEFDPVASCSSSQLRLWLSWVGFGVRWRAASAGLQSGKQFWCGR
jgi:hypothetical protein